MVYAVIDTNIIVSSFITKNPSSATRRVINSMLSGKIKPLYNEEILDEYFDVLNRSKFHLSEIRIHELLNFFKENELILLVFLMMEKCQMRTTESSMKSA